jgi:hypothetical protein
MLMYVSQDIGLNSGDYEDDENSSESDEHSNESADDDDDNVNLSDDSENDTDEDSIGYNDICNILYGNISKNSNSRNSELDEELYNAILASNNINLNDSNDDDQDDNLNYRSNKYRYDMDPITGEPPIQHYETQINGIKNDYDAEEDDAIVNNDYEVMINTSINRDIHVPINPSSSDEKEKHRKLLKKQVNFMKHFEIFFS